MHTSAIVHIVNIMFLVLPGLEELYTCKDANHYGTLFSIYEQHKNTYSGSIPHRIEFSLVGFNSRQSMLNSVNCVFSQTTPRKEVKICSFGNPTFCCTLPQVQYFLLVHNGCLDYLSACCRRFYLELLDSSLGSSNQRRAINLKWKQLYSQW